MNYERKRQLLERLVAVKAELDKTLAKEPIARAGVYASVVYEVIDVLASFISEDHPGVPIRMQCNAWSPNTIPSRCVGILGHVGAHADEMGWQWQGVTLSPDVKIIDTDAPDK